MRLEATSRVPLPSIQLIQKESKICVSSFCFQPLFYCLIGKVGGSDECYPVSQGKETHMIIT